MKFSTKILLITTALLLGACDGNNGASGVPPVEVPPTEFAMLQALNASPDGPNINVIVGSTAIASDMDFMGGTAEGSGPPGSQPISVEAVMPDDDVEIIPPEATDLLVDTVTTVVVTGPAALPQLSVFVQDVEEAVSAGSARVFVVHADPDVGSVDVYITVADADLDASAPLAADIDYEESGVPTEMAAAAYVLSITVADEPETVIFAQLISLADGDDLTMAIVPDASGFGEIQVVSMDGAGATTIYDIDTPAFLTIDHLSPNAGLVDVVSDVLEPMPLIVDMDYLEGYSDVPDAGPHELSFVDVVGMQTLASADVAGAPGSYDAVIFDGSQASVGGTFDLAATVFTESPRSVSSYAKARLYFASYSIGDVDVYVVAAGTLLTTEDPDIEAGAFRDMTGYEPLDAGAYVIIVTATGDETKTPLFTPTLVTFANGGVYTLILADVDALGLDWMITEREDNETFFAGP